METEWADNFSKKELNEIDEAVSSLPMLDGALE